MSLAERLGDETSPSLPVPGPACPAVQPLRMGRGWILLGALREARGAHVAPLGRPPWVWGWAPRLPQGVLEHIIRCTKKSLKEEREMLLLSVKMDCFLCVLH